MRAESVLAMAGKRSPWSGGNGGEGGPDEPSGESDGEEPPASEPAPGKDTPGKDKPVPQNPWRPSDGETPPRRSASIEDIFRQRGSRRPGGGGGGGGFPGFPLFAGGRSWAPRIAAVVALLWIASTSTHQLGQNEQGVVTTLGKYAYTVGPGVSLTLPWPLQSVSRRDVTTIIRTKVPDSEAEKLVLTSDKNLVDLSYQVRWKIRNLKQYTFELPDPDDTVEQVAEAAMRASVAEMPLNDVWGGAGRGELQDNVRRRMQAILDAYRSGVQVLGVEIKKADPPAKVADAFQKVNIAQQDAQRDMAVAQAWAQQKIAQAQGDAAAFDKVYAQYKLAPEVTRRRLYYETMERVLSNNDKVVVESNGVTSYLPLPEVKRRAPVDDGQSGTGGQ